MHKANKYEYLQVIQGDYGQGWEDIDASTRYKDTKTNLKLYRQEEPRIPFRVIGRRVLVNGYT